MHELVEIAKANIPGDADIEIRRIPPSEPEPTTRGFLIFTPDNFSRYGLDQFICNVFASGEGIQRIALKIDIESNKLVEVIVEFENRYISFLKSYNSYFERVYSDSGVSDYVREVIDNPDEFAVIDEQFERLDKMLRGLLIITKESRIPVDIRQALTTLLPDRREEPTNARYVFFRPEEFEVYGLRILVGMI